MTMVTVSAVRDRKIATTKKKKNIHIAWIALATLVLLLLWTDDCGGKTSSSVSALVQNPRTIGGSVSTSVSRNKMPSNRKQTPSGNFESSSTGTKSHPHQQRFKNTNDSSSSNSNNSNSNNNKSRKISTPKQHFLVAVMAVVVAAGATATLTSPGIASAAAVPGDSDATNSEALRWLQPRGNGNRRRDRASMQRLLDIRDLQDERLGECIDRGEYWEQCFFSGMRDDAKGIDYQWGSPEAALEIEIPLGRRERQQQQASSTTDVSSSLPRSQKPPTW